jgi:hypothetical protein
LFGQRREDAGGIRTNFRKKIALVFKKRLRTLVKVFGLGNGIKWSIQGMGCLPELFDGWFCDEGAKNNPLLF